MLNQLALLQGEKTLAAMLAERDQVIEGMCNQIDQMTKHIDQLKRQLDEAKAETTKEAKTPCQEPKP